MVSQPTEHAVITPQMLEDVRKRIGVEFTPRDYPFWNTQANWDSVRQYCWGIGEDNPLFNDAEYAKKSTWGTNVVPFNFLYSVYWCTGRYGLPGIHGWHSGNDWKLFKPILANDTISYTVKVTDLQEKKSQMAGRTFIEYCTATYRNQRNEIVATALGWSVRAERKASGEKGKYRDIQAATYSPEQLQKLAHQVIDEKPRGGEPRYWDDVKVGDETTPIIKGPLSMRDMFAYIMGGGSPFMKAHRIFYKYTMHHPGAVMIDSTTGQIDVPELVHMEQSRAQEIGIPGAYDYGCQRMSWLIHGIYDWMSDYGFCKRMYGELRRFNVVGDTQWIKGKVTKKWVDEKTKEHLVQMDVWAQNQRDEISAPGWAVIRLPTRKDNLKDYVASLKKGTPPE